MMNCFVWGCKVSNLLLLSEWVGSYFLLIVLMIIIEVINSHNYINYRRYYKSALPTVILYRPRIYFLEPRESAYPGG